MGLKYEYRFVNTGPGDTKGMGDVTVAAAEGWRIVPGFHERSMNFGTSYTFLMEREVNPLSGDTGDGAT